MKKLLVIITLLGYIIALGGCNIDINTDVSVGDVEIDNTNSSPVESFCNMAEGIYVNPDDVQIDGLYRSAYFYAFTDGEFYGGVFSSYMDRKAKIDDVKENGNIYTLTLYYPAITIYDEYYPEEYYPEECAEIKVVFEEGQFSFLGEAGVYKYMGATIDEAEANVFDNAMYVKQIPTTYETFPTVVSNAIDDYYGNDSTMKLTNVYGEYGYPYDNYGYLHGNYGEYSVDAYTVGGNISQIKTSIRSSLLTTSREGKLSLERTINLERTIKNLLVPVSIFFDGADTSKIVDTIYRNLEIFDNWGHSGLVTTKYRFCMDDVEIYIASYYYPGRGFYEVHMQSQIVTEPLYWDYGYDN